MSLREPVPVAPGTDAGVPAERPHRATAWPEARAAAVRAGTSARAGRAPSGVPLGQALGRVLTEPLTALTDLPSFDTSAMDGWAVTGPGPWTVIEEGAVLAGHAPATGTERRSADGEAVRIATGARIPPGTTAVVRTEHARTERPAADPAAAAVDPGALLLYALRDVVPGQDIRPRGQECRSGDELLPAGTLVTPAVLGLAAAAGYDTLPVPSRPRVEILVLGDELLTAGLPHEGLIRDALGPMLGPWLTALGADVLATRRIGDDAEELYAAVTGSTADLVVTTGGTAAGPVDHVHGVLDKAGATLLVDGVKVRPGHPMLLARLGASPGRPGGVRHLVGLPGNPLAAVSGLLTLAEPLFRALAAGEAAAEPDAETGAGAAAETATAGAGTEATAGTDTEAGVAAGTAAGARAAVDDHITRLALQGEVQGHPYDTRLVPVVRRGGRVVPLHYNGPAMLRGIAAADGLAVVPPGGARPGQELDVLDLPWPTAEGAVPAQGACFT
ncbi:MULTISPECIES: molybdopterin molybdotransferase MoeA [unclassified Streptomyces]|uniref:molybdopterin molybdotransferase MoeA n=1 Tax=unclassified Streptomyces TaxID=2593676 RepID=UPI0006FAE4B1|nr:MULTISPECIES: molybdopterin molybdotransferase MoeA [unclassified Streptomyces]KQX49536.1 molybdenum cofactor biosynthesis protein MoeA [Streptomyces sp. Root1304]KRA79155.1 molybdenum cofactor biosynthesis protein MoeA [Streptomyces sp. Root66D1]